MEIREIAGIIDEECGRAKNNGVKKKWCLPEIRRRVFLGIAEERIKQSVSAKSWDVFKTAVVVSVRCLLSRPPSGTVAIRFSLDAFQELLVLYENCVKLLNFLIDEYENLPEKFRNSWTPDQLISVAGYLEARKSVMFEQFALGKTVFLAPIDMDLIVDLARWTVQVIAGEEMLCQIAKEFGRALLVIDSDPRFSQFFSK